jgi:two-component system response regulator YesN
MALCHQILVIDDDDAQVRLLAKVVGRAFGSRADLTALIDATEALVWIERSKPDLVISDLEMPGASGLQILRATKRRNPIAQVILLTGKSSMSALREALQGGAADYLLKPLDADTLAEVMQQAIERVERWRRAADQASTRHGSLLTSDVAVDAVVATIAELTPTEPSPLAVK